MADQKPLLMLLDGHAMVFRAWFSIPERLSTSAGVDTRGVYGFMSTFIKVVNDHRPTHVALTFDTSKPDGMPRKLLDVGRLKALGWSPSIGFEEGIRSTYEWFEKNYDEAVEPSHGQVA